jgi:hypothetical protein
VKWRWKKNGLPGGRCLRRTLAGSLISGAFLLWIVGVWWHFAEAEHDHNKGGSQASAEIIFAPLSNPLERGAEVEHHLRPGHKIDRQEKQDRGAPTLDDKQMREMYKVTVNGEEVIRPPVVQKVPWASLAVKMVSGVPMREFDFTYKKGIPKDATLASKAPAAPRGRGGVEGRREEMRQKRQEHGADVAKAEREWEEELKRYRKKGRSTHASPFDYWVTACNLQHPR